MAFICLVYCTSSEVTFHTIVLQSQLHISLTFIDDDLWTCDIMIMRIWTCDYQGCMILFVYLQNEKQMVMMSLPISAVVLHQA